MALIGGVPFFMRHHPNVWRHFWKEGIGFLRNILHMRQIQTTRLRKRCAIKAFTSDDEHLFL